MAQYADALALRYDANRTRHAYYRQLRLIQQHFGADPATLSQAQLREYFLFINLKKRWKPTTIRQAVAASRMFFVDQLGGDDWTVFSQIHTPDDDTLPAVISPQVLSWLNGDRLLSYARRLNPATSPDVLT